jgi:quinoprotein relay system zinc metallohydrolase 2
MSRSKNSAAKQPLPLTRKAFLLASAGLVAALASRAVRAGEDDDNGPPAATDAASDSGSAVGEREAAATAIADGVFVQQGEHAITTPGNRGHICNLGFIVGRDAVAVIDTGGSAPVGEALKAAIAQQTGRPVRYVINTHMHPDHVLGNAAFEQPGVTFIGHHKLARALAARRDTYLNRAKEQLGEAAFKGTRMVFPTQAVEDRLTLDLGGRQLELTARPTAHTDNDLTVRDMATDTLFLGDLLFAEHVPTLDGSLRGWLALLQVLKAEPAARVVPGHGPVSMDWPAAAAPIEAYWTTLAADVRAAIADGQTMGDAIKTAGWSEKDKWQLFEEHHIRNISAAFAELEWED